MSSGSGLGRPPGCQKYLDAGVTDFVKNSGDCRLSPGPRTRACWGHHAQRWGESCSWNAGLAVRRLFDVATCRAVLLGGLVPSPSYRGSHLTIVSRVAMVYVACRMVTVVAEADKWPHMEVASVTRHQATTCACRPSLERARTTAFGEILRPQNPLYPVDNQYNLRCTRQL